MHQNPTLPTIERLESMLLMSATGEDCLIEILAAGEMGTEQMSLQIDGQTVQTWDNIGGDASADDFESFSYLAEGPISADRLRVVFGNDVYDPDNGIDTNLHVDSISIDGEVFETEAPSTYSTGTWAAEDGITPGFRQSQTLHTAGYFQYDALPDTGGDGSEITIYASGDEGTETMELRIGGIVVQTWDNVGTNQQAFQFTAGSIVSADDIQVALVNSAWDPGNGIDENLNVDRIEIDGSTFQTEDPSTLSTGTWTADNGIAPGNWQNETLHADGYFQYSGGTGGTGSTITIYASGSEGDENVDLQIGGITVSSWENVGTSSQAFTYTAADTVTADQVRVAFANDLFDSANGIDRNLIVDRIEIDGTVYQTEAPTTYSTGTWNPGGVVPGFYETETLHTNGYFEYDSDQTGGGSGTIGLTLDSLSIDESTGTLNVIVFREGSTEGTVTVDYATSHGTTNDGDYQGISGTLTFGPGTTGQQLSIAITDDQLQESDETFTINLTNPGGGATLGAITTQTVTIEDNDGVTAGVIFEDSFEGSTVWTTNPFGTDTATTGQWAAGAPSQTTSSGVTMQFGSGHTGSRALVTGLPAGSSVGTYDVDGGLTSVLSPEIEIPVGAETRLSFEYSFAHLSNSSGDDEFHVAIIANGVDTELYSDHGHASVRAAEWQSVEFDISQYAGQTIQILFEAADNQNGSLVEAAVDDVVVEVLPNLPGTFNIANTGVNLDEAAGTATFTVTRTSGRLGAVSVDYATQTGTANNNDFVATSGTLNFVNGQSEATITIQINDDDIEEDLESFSLLLSNPTGGAVLGSDTVGTVTIADNDNTVGDYLPDLTPIASTLTEAISIDNNEIPGRTLLRFSTEVANAGTGPLEIWGGSTSGNSQQVFQRIYQEDGGHRDTLAGEFVYHPGHGHIHFEGFANYNLQLTDGNGNIIASGGKTSFCLINIRQPLPGVTADAGVVHGRGGNSCGQIQGISAGYSDVYSASLDDQWIDITDVPDGDYTLQIVADPDDNIEELNENNNTASITIRLQNGNVSVL